MDFTNSIILFVHISAPLIRNVLLLLSLTMNFIFSTGIVYCGLKQLAIFSGINEKPKYATSQLRPQDYNDYLKRLIKHMEENKPYLNPDLSLDDLSSQLLILPRYLSQVIHQSTNQNFFEFINRHRIDEFKKQIINAADPKSTILEMLYNVGFNSKSSFNQAFKKYSKKGYNIFYKWYYDDGDDDYYDMVKDYCKILDIPIRLFKAS